MKNIKEIIRTINNTTILIYEDGSKEEFEEVKGVEIFKELMK